MIDILKQLPEVLPRWYQVHKRDLPWRDDRQPYHIWLSEVMLQQTRVEAVKGYYTRFLAALPNIESLANAPQEQLYKLWEGLGYYSRVRNLQKAARVILEQHSGHFPQDHAQVLALPGIGDYTAGAICSIAFDAPTPAVDGNVLRLVSRLTADTTPIDSPAYKKQVQAALAEVYPAHAGDFTQALMELGATVCGPNREPDCANCPCQAFCLGHAQGIAPSLPKKLPKRPKKQAEKTVFILCCDGCYALEKRPDQGLLAGLWQFPEAEGKLPLPQALEHLEKLGVSVKEVRRQVQKSHIFTHIIWEMQGLYLEVSNQCEKFTWLSADRIEQTAALPTAYRQFWEDKL